MATTKVIDTDILGIFVRIGIAGGAGYLWWNYNVVYGNAIAIDAIGIFAALPEFGRHIVVPVLGSVTQLYWAEDLDLGVLRHPAVAAFCVVVGVLDVLGPAYGFLITQDYEFTWTYILLSLVFSIFTSIICQEAAWRTTKDLVLWAKSQVKRAGKRRRAPRGATP